MRRITVLLLGIVFTAGLMAQNLQINPDYGYQDEYLDVTIVGSSTLFQGSQTFIYADLMQPQQGSQSILSSIGYLRQGTGTTAGFNTYDASYNFNMSSPVGYYNLLVYPNQGTGSTTITESNAFYLNPNLFGPGNIGGTVTSGSPKTGGGNSLAGQEMVLENTSSQTQLIAVTDENGDYEFRYLPVGDYELMATGVNNSLSVSITASNPNQTGVDVTVSTDRIDFVGIENVPNLAALSVFPNSFIDAFAVEVSLEAASELSLHLFTSNGQLVRDINKGQLAAGNHKLELTGLGQLSSGVYFLQLSVNDHATSQQVVKL